QPSSIHSLCSAPAPPHPTLIPQSPPHLLHLHPSPTRRSSDLVAGNEQGGLPLAHPRRRNRLQGRERAAGGAYGGAPNGGRQLEGGGCAHSGEPYLATLNKTSASAPRQCRVSGKNPDQEALRRVSP